MDGLLKKDLCCTDIIQALIDRDYFFKITGFEVTELIKNFCRFEKHKALEVFFKQIEPVENKKFIQEKDENSQKSIAELDDIPLGRQINEARRTTSSNKLQLYKYSNNQMVIENLLLNPRFTEALLLQILTRKQLSSELFKIIAKNEKWIRRYPVKKAIVFNPFAPFYISCIIIYLLEEKDLKMLINESKVSDILKDYGKEVQKLREICYINWF